MDAPARAIQDARMRRLLPFALAVLLPHLAAAQSVSLQDNALQDWTRLKDTMMKIAAAMPGGQVRVPRNAPERTWGEAAPARGRGEHRADGSTRIEGAAPGL
jgi:hypothetical protein